MNVSEPTVPEWVSKAVDHVASCVECDDYQNVQAEVSGRVCVDGEEEWCVEVHAPQFDPNAVFHVTDCVAAMTPDPDPLEPNTSTHVSVCVDSRFVLINGQFDGHSISVIYRLRARA